MPYHYSTNKIPNIIVFKDNSNNPYQTFLMFAKKKKKKEKEKASPPRLT